MKSFFSNVFRSFRLSLRFSKWTTIALTALILVTFLLPVYQAKIMGDIVNSIVGYVKSSSTGSILGLISVYSFVWVFTQILTAFKNYFDRIWTYKNEQGMEILVMKKRAEIDLGHYDDPNFQNLMGRAFRRGIWPIFEMVDLQISLIGYLATFLLTSIIATQMSFYVYVIAVITAIPTFIVSMRYGKRMWSIWAENSERQRKYQHVRQHMMGRTSIIQTKTLQASGMLIGIAENILNSFKKEQSTVDKKNLIYSVCASIVASVGIGFSFYLIISDVISGKEKVGTMVFLVSILGQLVGSINSIVSNLSRQYERNLYVKDIFEVLDTKPFLETKANTINLNLKDSPVIELKNVWFKYSENDNDWILKNINLVIRPGEKIALVGNNGAGKSTLVKLLSRVYDPTKGQILVNGVDLRDIDSHEWGSHLAILFQDYVSYDFLVKDSIAMGRPDSLIDIEKVQRAASFTEATEFINKFDRGFDQQLGKEFDEGIDLSKGQYQKMALSRIIYRDGLLTILDEPTSSIDAMSESFIFGKMTEASNGKTLIVITHRFNTTQNLDRIIVLESGEIVEQGNHFDLLKKAGVYASMFEAQAKTFYSEEIK